MNTTIPTSTPPPTPPSTPPPTPPAGARAMNLVRWILLVLLAAFALVSLGVYVQSRIGRPASKGASAQAAYHCPMHPTYTSDRPGDCPICGMALVPIRDGSAPGGATGNVPGNAVVHVPSERAGVAGITFVRARRGSLSGRVDAPATVTPDEAAVARLSLRVSGFVQRLLAPRVGETVHAGQPLLEIYSPELYQVESELLVETDPAHAGIGPGAAPAPGAAGMTHGDFLEAGATAAQTRLELLGVPADEVARLKRERTPSSRLVLRAPVGGIVLERPVAQGQAVGPDTPLLVVADLARLFIVADVPEREAARVRVGLPATFLPAADGAVAVAGRVAFVSPVVDPAVRAVRVRITVDSPADLASLRAGAVGRVRIAAPGATTLLVPSSSVIRTGDHDFVFAVRGGDHYVPQKVELGREADGWIEVRAGLAEGERVAAAAAFLLDAESRLEAALQAQAGADRP